MQYVIRSVNPDDVERCYEIESSAYSIEEAASKEKIRIRAEQFPQGFIVLEVEHQVIGFINSGCTDEVVMSDENFKELKGHTSLGKNLVIMSVVIDPQFQGKGYSAKLMHEFINISKTLHKEAIYLMCKEQYLKLYEKFGFEFVEESDSSHGGMKWFEMKLELI
jgi:ribosomal protein S18 acetylase RimI-like enzyme